MFSDDTLSPAGIRDAATIPDLFLRRVAATPDAIAYREFRDGRWHDISWRGVGALVDRRRAAFTKSGLAPGDRVGIFLPNGTDWVVTDLAAMAEGLVTVPVYTRDSAGNLRHVIRHSGAALCVTDTAERWRAIEADHDALPDLRAVWLLDRSGPHGDPRLLPCPDPNPEHPGRQPLTGPPDSLATLIYTSGTTGLPKGVMLSHRNLLSNADSVIRLNPVRRDDGFLSILPLAHGFERTLGWLCPMQGGATVVFSRSIETLAEDLREQRPTILLAVPRLFDKVRNAARDRASRSRLAGWLFVRTEAAGWARFLAAQPGGPPPALGDRLFWAVAGRHVARRLRQAFGGRMRIVLAGGAPMAKATSRFLAAMEFPLIEGYGLTEAGPAVTGCRPQEWRSGSVGYALPGVELALGARQELLVRSAGVMSGYWQDPAASADALDADGWLHTGDVAEIVDGWVYVRGRIKDIIVLSTGENVNPVPIETAILSDPLISQACVVGDGRPGCAAVVVVDPQAIAAWLKQIGLAGAEPGSPEARRRLIQRFDAQLPDVPPFARIRTVHVETRPWDLASGLITPTMKAKRPQISRRYAREINDLYNPPG